MNGPAAAPASRNAPCPCGSGLRYKACHGLIASPAPSASLDRLAEARAKAQAGDFDAAAKLCDEVLSREPGHPVALEILALRETEAGQSMAALRTLLRAARGLAEHPLPPAAAYSVWSALNSAFLDALGGLDAAAARGRRESYRQALLEVRTPTTARDVAVILLVRAGDGEDAITVSLDSILAQTRLPAELFIVAPIGTTIPGPCRARLVGLPFPVRTIAVPAADSIASALDAAVAETLATFVVALDPPNAFAPAHLETLVDAIADRAALWGFADCEHFAFGHASAETLAPRMAAAEATRTAIARAESVGMAFLGQSFAATGLGAVAFARALHTQVGGFRSLPGHEVWDFALRAMWLAEPVHAPRPTYRHAATAHGHEISNVQRESAQLEMFRSYYVRACDAAVASPNPFAPSLANWGLVFARRLFQCGHVLMVSLDKLDALAGQIADARADAQPAKLRPGLNLIGFAFGEFGLGENLRALARACETGGIPFVVKDVDLHLATRQADRSIAHHLSDDLQHRLSLVCLNPDFLSPVRAMIESTRPLRALLKRTRDAGGRNVGYWYWELETVPSTWEPAYPLVDEVWCATEFVATAIRRATAQPVIKIPPPLEVALARPCARVDFGLRDEPFLFLFTFDYNSFVKRKNPEAVIAAFRAAFPRGRDDVGLVVKSVNGVHRPERVAAITALIGDDSRIVNLDRYLSRDEAYALTAATDAYVSLHRAEGLGLGLAEAMALGRPTIATAYSGNLEFMNEGNSLLVDYRIIPIAPGEYLVDDERFVWADPDIESAARHMRSLADDPALRARLVAAGQQTIRNGFTREHTARLLRQRLVELGILDSPAANAGARTRAGDSRAAKPPPPATAAPFVSHAQHGEDALLAQVLRDVEVGRYVDVGANDPDRHSVTRAFYERGWSGVNVEPVAEWHARLVQARPRDINLAVAVAETGGTVQLHEYAGTGLSTLDATIAQRHARAGFAGSARDVPAMTLAEVFDANVAGDVHFLKVDVEGAETSVLAGADFRRHRPWIVLVEATAPLTGIASHSEWEPLLLAAGYRFAHDDGLNRYYVSDEHGELAERFAQDADASRVISAAEALASAQDLAPEQRFDPRSHAFLDGNLPEPTLASPTSQLCTFSQFGEPLYRDWCSALREVPTLHRKQWEFVYILRVLELAGFLAPGRRGLGFGCGREPLVAAMATRGCEVVATDLDLGSAAGQGWIETGQHSRALDDLNDRGICAPELFRERVVFRAQDMNQIDADLTGFDFVWSSCAFEHLGSIRHGLEFVENAMRCLRPGGIAVHTTEFNLSSNGTTLESPTLSVFRRRDIDRLVHALESEGHRVWPLNLQPGAEQVDRYVDLPPYRAEPHLKLRLSRFVITSVGLVIERSAG